MGTSLVAVVVAAGGLAASGGVATASPPSGATQPAGLVTTAKPTLQAKLMGTTKLAFGGQAGPGGQSEPGSTSLPSTLSPSQMPHTPDVGDQASTQTVHSASLSTSSGSHTASPAYPSVSGGAVSGATAGLASAAGLDSYDQGVTHPTYNSAGQPQSLPGVDIEPPDQGVCAGNGYVLEVNNMVARVFTASLTGPTSAAPLESLFGTPEVFGSANDGTYSVQGDPRCFYDAGTGRWFASQLWLDLNDATSSYGWAGTFVAVSTTSSPLGSWHVYFVPDADNATGTATCNNLGPSASTANPCFGDQPLLGVDANTVQISTNEYSIFGANPNGAANLYFLSKSALVSGKQSVTTDWSPVGTTVAAPGAGPWYSLAPAQSPDGKYSTAQGGTSYALSSLDFTGSGDNRVAEWAYTNTGAVNQRSGAINIFEQTLSSGQYAMPPAVAAQQAGPTPLGDSWTRLNGSQSNHQLPEGGLATNDDRMGTATYDPSDGALVGALNTGVNQTFNGTVTTLTGIAHFAVTPALTTGGLAPSAVTTGYISPGGANAIFPAAAITTGGEGVVSYTLSGTGYYPSQAYSLVSAGDVVDPTAHVASAGAGPQDGFTEYQGAGTVNYRPRWGDYGEAVATGSTITFANEMIHSVCTDSQFSADFTCGATRDLSANWGTEVNTLTTSP